MASGSRSTPRPAVGGVEQGGGYSRPRRRSRRHRCAGARAHTSSTSRSITGRWPPAAPAVRSLRVHDRSSGRRRACGPSRARAGGPRPCRFRGLRLQISKTGRAEKAATPSSPRGRSGLREHGCGPRHRTQAAWCRRKIGRRQVVLLLREEVGPGSPCVQLPSIQSMPAQRIAAVTCAGSARRCRR